MAKWLQPTLQRDMWSTMMTLIPMVLEDTMVVVEILMKSDYMLTRYIIQKPTTYRGNCIDHFYHNIPEAAKKVEHKLHNPYYSDHEAVCVMIKDAMK